MMRRPNRRRALASVRGPRSGATPRSTQRARDGWWLSWGLGAGALLAIGFIDFARAGFDWRIAPIGFLYGSCAYFIVLGCLRRTSWLQERHVRRMRRLMTR